MGERSGTGSLVAGGVWLPVLRVLLACTGLAVALGASFVALLALALTFSSDARIETNLHEAADNRVLSRNSYPPSPFGRMTVHQYDMYTDCVAFGLNLSNQEEGLLRRIARSPTAAHETGQVGPCGHLVDTLRAAQVDADQSYLRFWHGYQIYFRPVLSIMPLDAFRRLTAILFFTTLLFFAWRVDRVFGPWAWLIALGPFFVFSDFLTVPILATHAVSLIWAFGSAALVPVILERVANARALALPLFAFAAGATSNFMNFLINPPLAPALMVFFYIAISLARDARDTRASVLYAAGLAALWFAGFAAAWIEKWLFAALVLGPDAVTAEIARTVEKYEATRARLGVNFLGASRRNVMNDPWLFTFLLASIAAACAAVAWLVRRRGEWRERLTHFIALTAPPLAVIVVWVEVNSIHSAEHTGFVSRSFLLFSIVPLLAALKLWRDARAAAPAPRAADALAASRAA